MWCHVVDVVDVVDLIFRLYMRLHFFCWFGLGAWESGMLGKLVVILILMLSTGQALLEADREAAWFVEKTMADGWTPRIWRVFWFPPGGCFCVFACIALKQLFARFQRCMVQMIHISIFFTLEWWNVRCESCTSSLKASHYFKVIWSEFSSFKTPWLVMVSRFQGDRNGVGRSRRTTTATTTTTRLTQDFNLILHWSQWFQRKGRGTKSVANRCEVWPAWQSTHYQSLQKSLLE